VPIVYVLVKVLAKYGPRAKYGPWSYCENLSILLFYRDYLFLNFSSNVLKKFYRQFLRGTSKGKNLRVTNRANAGVTILLK
jgi:hypothetical protein